MEKSEIIFNKLKEYWFNNKNQNDFELILNDSNLNSYEIEIKCMEYLQKSFANFCKENNYTEINPSTIEVLMNWGILMYLQIKDKLDGTENNI